jgi:CxxC motif-containing protein (DUF1111 family)
MLPRARILAAIASLASAGLFASVWSGNAQVVEPPLGSPLPGLSSQGRIAFETGKDDFQEVHGREDGLGPVFNGRSCSECHNQGAVGGAGDALDSTSVTRFGKAVMNGFDPMVEAGGSLIQRRSLREIFPECPITGEVVPKQATVRTRRISTPLFGAGLIEAIPNEEILHRSDPWDTDRDGISGRAHLVQNPETRHVEIGRFGWKAQHSSLHMFSGDAYLNELGVTSPTFPEENLPQGKPIPAPWYTGPETDDDGEDISLVATFMRFLAAPSRGVATPQARLGEELFMKVGCATCHTPSMTTSVSNPTPALRRKTVRLYSDLLLHDMGTSLADGVVQGQATGREFRTPPLWGLGRRKFFLHDGRASDLRAAIALHEGEGARVKWKYESLGRMEQTALLEFLRSL